jgi:alpha-mannosidase
MGSIGFWGCIAIFAVPRFFGSSVVAEETTPTRESVTLRQAARYDLSKDKVLYIIGYAHLDTQWRWTYQDSINKFIPNTMHENFRLLEKYPAYVFNFTGARRYMMMKEYYPEDYDKVKNLIAQGRWNVCGSAVDEADANLISPESVIRHILYGNGFFEKEFGKRSVDYMLPDCFGFPASLPSILSHCGLKGFSTQKLSWGSAAGIPFTIGVWEGPDGNGVVAALDPGGYGSSVDKDMSQDEEILKRIDALGTKAQVYADFRYYGTGDIGGSPTEQSVERVDKSVASQGLIRVLASSADQLFRDLSPAQISRLPRYKGDLLLTQHSAGCLTSQSYMKRWNRKNEFLADAAERASVTADWIGAAVYPREKLKAAWILVLGNQMHDILPGTSIPQAYEFSWNDEILALNQFAAVLENGVGGVSRALDTRVKGIPIVVYNSLSTLREDLVQAKVKFSGQSPPAIRVYDPKGKEVPSQIQARQEGALDILFLAKAPSVGFSVYDVRPSQDPCRIVTNLFVTDTTLENERYLVKLDENGDVRSLWDKTLQKEILGAPARLAFLKDAPAEWPAWNMDWKDLKEEPSSYVKGPAQIRIVEKGPARIALEVTRRAEGSTFVQRICLAAGGAGDRVEYRASIDWRTRGSCLKATFPLTASNPIATYTQGLGAIERSNDDPKKYEVPSHQWFDLTDKGGEYGVAVLEDSKFGSDKPDDHTLRLTLLRTPEARQYHDQATQDLGQHEMVYALASHQGDWRRGEVPWKAVRLNQPLVAFQTEKHSGSLGKSFCFLRLNTTQVAVKALKKAEHSDEIIIRLQEMCGIPAPGVEVMMGAPILSARELNGQEDPMGKAMIIEGPLSVSMSPYSLRTFAVKPAPPPVQMKTPLCQSIKIDYNISATSFDDNKSQADFDGGGRSYPAELLSPSLTSEGIVFHLGPINKGQANALACKGQHISLPSGDFNRLYLLAAAVGGDVSASFKIDGKTMNFDIQEWTGKIGQWDNRIWGNEEFGITGLIPGFVKRASIAWFASHRHNVKGENEAYQYCYLFKYGIDLPDKARTVVLPENDRIRIFAMTLAQDENAETRPAQPLYDSLHREPLPPSFEPEGGVFSDSIKVRILPPWYNAGEKIHYTLDWSDPTRESPVYTAPVYLYESGELKARIFGKKGEPGILGSALFQVDDRTPPRILSVHAGSLAPEVRISFSEPLDRKAAEEPDNYQIQPDVKILSASLSEEGDKVILNIPHVPVEGQTYNLGVRGLADRSPGVNEMKPVTRWEFIPWSRVFYLKCDDADRLGMANIKGEMKEGDLKGNPKASAGKVRGAIHLDGEGDCLVFPDSPALNPASAITLSAWFRAEDWEGNRRILQKGREDDQYRLLRESGEFKFSLAGVGEIKAPVPSAQEWHHAAGTYDGQMMRLFIDGVLAAEKPSSGKIQTTPDPLFIGAKRLDTVPGDFFKGELDELMIWEYALSLDQVHDLMSGK